MTGADCIETNRKRIRGTQSYLHNSNSLSRFDFIYPRNLYLFSASPQISVAADNNRFYNPVLLFSDHQTKFVNKPYWSLFALYPGPKRFPAISSRRLGKSEGRSKTDTCYAGYPPPSQFALSFHSVIWYSNRSTTRWQKGEKKKEEKKSSKLNVRQHKGRRKKYKKNLHALRLTATTLFFRLVRSSNYAVFLPCRNWLFQIIWGEDIPLYSITWLIQKPKAQRHVTALQTCPPYPCWNTDTTETE